MCEGRTLIEGVSVTGVNYNFPECTDNETVSEVINWKIDSLLNEEDSLNEKMVERRATCCNLGAAYNKHVGPHERSWLDAF